MINPQKEIIRNGDQWEPFYTYVCYGCGVDLPENNGFIEHGDEAYCNNCAFKCGFIDSKTYMKAEYFSSEIFLSGKHKAVVVGDKIKIVPIRTRKTDYRQAPVYKHWRTSVFKRDKYTCQNCAVVGGILNAHHIRPFKTYKRLRYSLKNGITLCVSCHIEAHSA